MPSVNSNSKLCKAAASDPVVPKHVTMQLYTKLLVWLKRMEGVTGSEGAKAPGAGCNQLSGSLHGVKKRKRKKNTKMLSKWKAGF